MLTTENAVAGIVLVSNAIRRARTAGFTLIELVIVMLIVTILAAVALPSYASYIAKARRADAKSQLMQVAQYMRAFYAANDSFVQDRAANSVLGQIPPALLQSPADATKIYGLLIPESTLTDGSFEIRMSPVAGGRMSTDQCGVFTLTSTGVRGVMIGEVAGEAALRDQCWQ